MKRIIVRALSGLMALATVAFAQTTTSGGSTTSTASTGFAPMNFGNVILTSTPSDATGNSGVSTVYTTSGDQFTFGTGGRLVNPTQFNYMITGPNSATIEYPATDTSPASTTNLVFTTANSGTYTTVSGTKTTTGTFGLSSIPGAAPIENVSTRTTVTEGGTTIVGFVIGGTMPHRVLIRAVGPGLASFGVANPLQNPMVSLYRGSELIATNDNWGTLLTSTATARGNSGEATASTITGNAPSANENSSATTGNSSIPAGTTGNGVFSGTLANGNTFTTQLATGADFTQVGAFGLAAGSNDAAFVATLPPGAYTVVVTSSTASGAASTSANTSSTLTAPTATTSGSMTAGSTTGTSTTSTRSTSSGSITSSTATTSGGTTGGSSSTGTSTTSVTTSGSTTGGTTSGTGTTTLTSSTGATTSLGTSATTGEVLVEVYFMQ